jgi:hypothetical protein
MRTRSTVITTKVAGQPNLCDVNGVVASLFEQGGHSQI